MTEKRIYVRPELTPEGIREAAIQMFRELTGREPTAEELAEIGADHRDHSNAEESLDKNDES